MPGCAAHRRAWPDARPPRHRERAAGRRQVDTRAAAGFELGCPALIKDDLKKSFADRLGAADTTVSRPLGALASDLLWDLAALVDDLVVVESFGPAGAIGRTWSTASRESGPARRSRCGAVCRSSSRNRATSPGGGTRSTRPASRTTGTAGRMSPRSPSRPSSRSTRPRPSTCRRSRDGSWTFSARPTAVVGPRAPVSGHDADERAAQHGIRVADGEHPASSWARSQASRPCPVTVTVLRRRSRSRRCARRGRRAACGRASSTSSGA